MTRVCFFYLCIALFSAFPSGLAAQVAGVPTLHCHTAEAISHAYHVVYPDAPVMLYEGADAAEYLHHFNDGDYQTNYRAESLLVIGMGINGVVIHPIVNGVACFRLFAGVDLHRYILTQMAKGKI